MRSPDAITIRAEHRLRVQRNYVRYLIGALQTIALPDGGKARVFRNTRFDPTGRPVRVEVVGTIRDHHELARLLEGIALAAPPTLGLAVLVGLFLAGRALQPNPSPQTHRRD